MTIKWEEERNAYLKSKDYQARIGPFTIEVAERFFEGGQVCNAGHEVAIYNGSSDYRILIRDYVTLEEGKRLGIEAVRKMIPGKILSHQADIRDMEAFMANGA